jgi:DNA polymerase-1
VIETLSGALLPGELPLSQISVTFVDSLDDVLAFKEWLSKPHDVMAIDTETTGLNTYKDDARIRLVQFGDQNSAYVINAEKWAGIAMEALETYTGAPHVWHNVNYDYQYIRAVWPELKFQWGNTHDTMIYHKLHASAASAKLKDIGNNLWGNAATFGQELLNKAFNEGGWDWKTIPMAVPAYSLYSAMDVILTARLFMRLGHIHSGPFKHLAAMEMQTARICADMSVAGMYVDRDYCREGGDKLHKYVDDTVNILADYHGINIRSGPQLAAYFQNQGAVLTRTTEKGAWSMDAKALQQLAEEGFSLADTILDVRKADKLAGTYFDNLLEFSDNPSRLIHPEINTIEARTGRMSVSKPSMQNMPSGSSLIRNAFVATKGHKLVTCDFSQIEMRLTAHLSSDPALLAAFKECDATGDDFFTRIGRDLYGPAFQKKDIRRQLIKNVMYGSTYGAGVATMARSAKVDISVMQPIADDIFSRFVGVKGIQRMATREAEHNLATHSRPFITTASGRRLFVDEDKMYSAANYAVQGFAADCMKQALIRLDNEGLGPLLRLPVHDEIIMLVPDSDVDEVKRIVSDTMTITEEMGFQVGIPAEADGPFDKWQGKA